MGAGSEENEQNILRVLDSAENGAFSSRVLSELKHEVASGTATTSSSSPHLHRTSPWENLLKADEKLPPFIIIDSTGKAQRPAADLSPAKVFELYRLENRSGDHQGPDAVVRLPANFDSSKPINLVIYNHGWGSTARSAFRNNELSDQMSKAPPNTVLIVPEWQRVAGASNGDQGAFEKKGLFRAMLLEIFQKTPGLQDKTLENVSGISIFAHSAGYGPTETEIYKNGLGSKVMSITLLDSLYDNRGFDPWIQDNLRELSAGSKQFYNFYNDTSKYSRQQALRVREMFRKAGLPESVIAEDNNGMTLMDSSTRSRHSVVFKFSDWRIGKNV
ncbi:MAG: hypothetical protein K2X27_09830, partial [Candidatus Obscuribacterales bacterium]|nr:hypothetical protein [Candidatus Obscuribacterales bacterium]